MLKDRVAIVTGGGAGIGAATAAAFARNGARVVIVDIDGDAAESTASSIRDSGGDARCRVADAGKPDELVALYDFVEREFGRLDVLHNNHVWTQNGRIGDLELDAFRASLEIGLVSYFHSTKLALGLMLRQGRGAIVNTASVCGLAGDFGVGAYNVLKAGVINLTRATALDYADRGIRCNAVCPGPTLTKPYMAMRVDHPDVYDRTVAAVPMGRLAEPEEIADGVLFLASDLARFVTGTTLAVDGGLSAWTGLPGATANVLD